MQSQHRLGTERPHRRRCDAVSGVRGPGGIARLSVGDPEGISRALLHVATDLPGHFPPGHHGGVGSGGRGRRCSVPWSTGEVIHRGRILWGVPKSYLPTYREFYERRQVALDDDAPVSTIPVVAGGTRSGRTCNWPPHLCAASVSGSCQQPAQPACGNQIRTCVDQWPPPSSP
jgi:hypothetical protein